MAALILAIQVRTEGNLSLVHQFFMILAIAGRTGFVFALLQLKSLKHSSLLRVATATTSYVALFGLAVIVTFGF